MMSNNSILITLCYAQIFHDSLSLDEIHQWLLVQKVSKPTLKKKLLPLVSSGKIHYRKGRYSLSLKSDFTSHQQILESKLFTANQAVRVLRLIPMIRLVAVSGSVAAGRPNKNSDIDFFIICQKDSVWITRLFCSLALLIFKQKRNRLSKIVSNKICLNMYIDEANMLIQTKDIYSAREILQIIPLLNRNRTYEKFLYQNRWASKIFPNIAIDMSKYRFVSSKSFSLLSLINRLFFCAQYLYMLRHLTIEKITSSQIRFHPVDYHSITLIKFSRILSRHNIKMTDSERVILFGNNIDKKN